MALIETFSSLSLPSLDENPKDQKLAAITYLNDYRKPAKKLSNREKPSSDPGLCAEASKLFSKPVIAFDTDNVDCTYDIVNYDNGTITQQTNPQCMVIECAFEEDGDSTELSHTYLIGGEANSDTRGISDNALKEFGRRAIEKSLKRTDFHRKIYQVFAYQDIFRS